MLCVLFEERLCCAWKVPGVNFGRKVEGQLAIFLLGDFQLGKGRFNSSLVDMGPPLFPISHHTAATLLPNCTFCTVPSLPTLGR